MHDKASRSKRDCGHTQQNKQKKRMQDFIRIRPSKQGPRQRAGIVKLEQRKQARTQESNCIRHMTSSDKESKSAGRTSAITNDKTDKN